MRTEAARAGANGGASMPAAGLAVPPDRSRPPERDPGLKMSSRGGTTAQSTPPPPPPDPDQETRNRGEDPYATAPSPPPPPDPDWATKSRGEDAFATAPDQPPPPPDPDTETKSRGEDPYATATPQPPPSPPELEVTTKVRGQRAHTATQGHAVAATGATLLGRIVVRIAPPKTGAREGWKAPGDVPTAR